MGQHDECLTPPELKQLLELARRRGVYAGLDAAAAEDCAAAFVEQMLEKRPTLLNETRGPERLRWLCCCARNFARDFKRRELRHTAIELVWPERTDSNDCLFILVVQDKCIGPHGLLLRQEFWKRVEIVRAKLPPDQQILFVSFYLNGDSVLSIAQATGRTPAAVRQALVRLRKHLKSLLEKDGLTETELCEYLTDIHGDAI